MADLASFERISFEFGEYERLLTSMVDDGFSFERFGRLESDQVVLRHDVDLDPKAALKMARVEASLDITATYCFLLTTPVYNLLEVDHAHALGEIQRLGHDVALHFNTHYYWDRKPQEDELTTRVLAECDVLGVLTGKTIDVVSFHRPPEWVLDVDFDGFENTYQPRFFGEIEYRSDSRQKWRTEPPFPDGRPDRLQLLVHPGLWGKDHRSMDEIITDLSERRRRRLDDYLGPLER